MVVRDGGGVFDGCLVGLFSSFFFLFSVCFGLEDLVYWFYDRYKYCTDTTWVVVWILMIVSLGPVARADWRTWENPQNALVWKSLSIVLHIYRFKSSTICHSTYVLTHAVGWEIGISPTLASVCGTKTRFKGAPAIQNWSPGAPRPGLPYKSYCCLSGETERIIPTQRFRISHRRAHSLWISQGFFVQYLHSICCGCRGLYRLWTLATFALFYLRSKNLRKQILECLGPFKALAWEDDSLSRAVEPTQNSWPACVSVSGSDTQRRHG